MNDKVICTASVSLKPTTICPDKNILLSLNLSEEEAPCPSVFEFKCMCYNQSQEKACKTELLNLFKDITGRPVPDAIKECMAQDPKKIPCIKRVVKEIKNLTKAAGYKLS